MKKLLIIITILMTISFNANAGFLLGYAIGHGNCSCTKEKNEIKELKEENDELKEKINQSIKIFENKTDINNIQNEITLELKQMNLNDNIEILINDNILKGKITDKSTRETDKEYWESYHVELENKGWSISITHIKDKQDD